MGNNLFGKKSPELWDKSPELWGQKKEKRSIGNRDKHILYITANKRCENCGKRLAEHEMQVGHKKAYSKNGKTKLANSVALCYPCNNLQGTDSWETFRTKLHKPLIPTAMSHLERKRQPSTKKASKKKKTNKLRSFGDIPIKKSERWIFNS